MPGAAAALLPGTLLSPLNLSHPVPGVPRGVRSQLLPREGPAGPQVCPESVTPAGPTCGPTHIPDPKTSRKLGPWCLRSSARARQRAVCGRGKPQAGRPRTGRRARVTLQTLWDVREASAPSPCGGTSQPGSRTGAAPAPALEAHAGHAAHRPLGSRPEPRGPPLCQVTGPLAAGARAAAWAPH